ncbi:DNA internalization-related competence protein ComEC/Rec2 [Aliikangiella sp. IMCC44653]
MFKNAVVFLGGLLLAVISRSFETMLLLLLAALCGYWLAFRTQKLRLVAWLTFGVVWGSVTIVSWNYTQKTIVKDPVKAQVSGYVCGIPTIQRRPSHQLIRFDFCVVKLQNLSNTNQAVTHFKLSKKVQASWRQYRKPYLNVSSGESLTLSAKLKPIHDKVNPKAFNFERWQVSQGYFANLSVKRVEKGTKLYSISQQYHQLRSKLYFKLANQIPFSETKGLVLAMVMGERAQISDNQWEAFQHSGTSHLLAISGLHVGIAAMWSYWFVLAVCRRSTYLCQLIPAQKLAEVGAVLGALVLTLASGCGVPSVRALIMLSCYFLAKSSGRNLTLFNTIGVGLLVILITMPLSVLSASFWLSFSAVLLIGLVVSRQIAETSKLKAWLAVNFYLFLLMVPVGWLVFDNISFVALITNVILIPFYSFIVTPLTYIASLVTFVSAAISELLFSISQFFIELGIMLQSLLSDINKQINQDFITLSVMLWVCLLIAAMIFPRRLFSRAWLFYCCVGGVATLTLGSNESKNAAESELTLWVFDVGHGLAVWLQTENKSLLFDTAWGSGQYAVANTSLMPFLKSQRGLIIDTLVISHADKDHSGGFEQLNQSVRFKRFITGAHRLKLSHSKVTTYTEPKQSASLDISANTEANLWENCHTLPEWSWGDTHFEFINHLPTSGYKKLSSNNQSCVLKLQKNDTLILLTGDLEKSGEKRLLQQFRQPVDVLIAPHHGSKTSSTLDFVQTYQPKHVIFSTGFANQWHFPRKEVLARYRAVKSQVWVTHEQGAIKVSLKSNNRLVLSGLRQESPWFWYKQY